MHGPGLGRRQGRQVQWRDTFKQTGRTSAVWQQPHRRLGQDDTHSRDGGLSVVMTGQVVSGASSDLVPWCPSCWAMRASRYCYDCQAYFCPVCALKAHPRKDPVLSAHLLQPIDAAMLAQAQQGGGGDAGSEGGLAAIEDESAAAPALPPSEPETEQEKEGEEERKGGGEESAALAEGEEEGRANQQQQEDGQGP